MSGRALAIILLAATLFGGCDSGSGMDDNAVKDDVTEIALMIVYTLEAADAVPDIQAYLEQSVTETNQTYATGDIAVGLKLVRSEPVDYQLTERLQDLERLIRTDDGFLDEIHEWRDTSEADLVVFVVENRSSTINAAVMAEPSTAFAIVNRADVGAPSYGMAHELGHLFGARHHPLSDSRAEPFPFGHGFRDENVRTIMANGPQTVVPFYSGPDQFSDGTVLGDSLLSNVARVFRTTAAYISNFRGDVTPTEFAPDATFPVVTFAE